MEQIVAAKDIIPQKQASASRALHAVQAGGREWWRAWRRSASLISRGSRFQFATAMALISCIPMLALGFLAVSSLTGGELPAVTLWSLLLISPGFMVLGHILLARYPRNIVRLRKYLEDLASDALPPQIELAADEDDLATIATCMRFIVAKTRERIATIEKQSKALVKAEQQRVMIESFATVCHHMGQPFTAILIYLDLLKNADDQMAPALRKMIEDCEAAAERVADILRRLQATTHYEAEVLCRIQNAKTGSGVEISAVKMAE